LPQRYLKVNELTISPTMIPFKSEILSLVK
jgi:hypothetical protein